MVKIIVLSASRLHPAEKSLGDIVMHSRNLFFILFIAMTFPIFYKPLTGLIRLSFHEELYSHIMFIPIVSGLFIFKRRKAIFSTVRYSYVSGLAFILPGIFLYLIGMNQGIRLDQNDYLSLMTFSAVITWIGGFILFYGINAFRNAAFPLLFLMLMIPIPGLVMERIVLLLQKGSAEAAYGLFKLTGVPMVREGCTFHFPFMSVEVAKQCSGIHSSIALFITGVLAGQFFLTSGWRKLILLLSILPLAIIKNGVRIVTLSLLALYVDEEILTNSMLHKKGGIIFFLIALILLTPVFEMLRRSEKKNQKDEW
jgi:exosortase